MKRLPVVPWIAGASLPSGSPQWFSRDGMLRMICSEGYGLPRLWQVWRWKHGGWIKAAEFRSQRNANRVARRIAAELEAEESED